MPKYLTTKSGRKILLNTPEEDAIITAAAMSDPDAIPLTDEEWEKVRPTVRRGRPQAESTKVHINIRISPEVAEFFRATGQGWQTRINDALREYVKTHSPR
ncbi:conserved hypothetical protein [Gammaproteobacteria bacterium]